MSTLRDLERRREFYTHRIDLHPRLLYVRIGLLRPTRFVHIEVWRRAFGWCGRLKT